MRVVHVNTERGWRGGEQQLLYLARGLRRHGVDQEVICQRDSALAERMATEGVPTTRLAMGGYLDLRSSRRIRERLRAVPTQILHLHTAQAHAIGVRAAKGAGSPRPRTVISRRVSYSIFRHSFLRLNRLKYTRGVDRIVCVADAVRAQLLADGLAAERLRVVPSGVDLKRFQGLGEARQHVRDQLALAPGARLIGHVGAFTPEKGHQVLLDALLPILALQGDLHLVLVGTGPLQSSLQEQVGRAGLEGQVHFVGFQQDPPRWLAALDVFVFPSLSEGIGGTLIEALALGLACVASRTGGLPEVARDEQEALLVPPGDAPALARAALRLLADPALGARLGAAGRQRVEQQFTWEHMVKGTLDVYRELLSERREG